MTLKLNSPKDIERYWAGVMKEIDQQIEHSALRAKNEVLRASRQAKERVEVAFWLPGDESFAVHDCTVFTNNIYLSTFEFAPLPAGLLDQWRDKQQERLDRMASISLGYDPEIDDDRGVWGQPTDIINPPAYTA